MQHNIVKLTFSLNLVKIKKNINMIFAFASKHFD